MEKKGIIDLAVNMILSDSGQLFFSGNTKAVKKITDKSGNPKLGISNQNFNAPVVQKLVMNSYIEEIFLREPELLSKRQQIIDTNNLIIYAILYRKLSPALAEMLLQSPIMTDYNRKNPRNQINDLKQIDVKRVAILKSQKKELFEMVEIEIHSEVVQRILKNTALEEEDRMNRIKSLTKFIQCIDSRIWYLYLILYQSNQKEEVKSTFADMIADYLDRTKISIYMNNLLMEFIQSAQMTHFERIFSSQHLKGEELELVLADEENRKWAIDEARQKNQYLVLSWDISSEASFNGKNYRLLVRITNHGLIGEALKALSSQRGSDYKPGRELYTLSSEIGAMMVENIERLCKKEKVGFRMSITPDIHTNTTTSTIEFKL